VVDCKLDDKKGRKTLLALTLIPIIVGTSFSTFIYNYLNEKWKSEASFIYVDSGVQDLKLKSKNYTSLNQQYDFVKYTTVVLRNDGDKPGIITSVAVNEKESDNQGQFFASHSVTPLTLRKYEYQQVESLLCPPKTYCEISFKGTHKVVGFDISQAVLKIKI